MTTVWLALRADLRRRWRPLLSLALLLGLIGGVILTAATGARRTDTAYPRLLQWARASQVSLIPEGTGLGPARTTADGYYAALARLPQVSALTTGVLDQLIVPASPGGARPGGSAARGGGTSTADSQGIPVQAWASADGGMGRTVDRVKILAGRLLDPAGSGQAMIDQNMAALEHLKPGDTLRLTGVPNDPNGTPDFAKAVPLTFRVTAVVAFDNAIVPMGMNASEPTVLLSPSFAATQLAGEPGIKSGDEAAVRLRPGASMTAFLAAARKLAKSYPRTRGQLNIVSPADQVAATEQAIRPQALALALFAALAGLIALAVIGQLLARQLTLDAAEFPLLRALGATRGSLVMLSLGRLALVTVPGAVLAVTIAVAASPMMPIGPARLAEPRPGIEVNLAMLTGGFAAITLLPLALLVRAAWRAAGRAAGQQRVAEPAVAGRPSRLSLALGVAGSVPASVGVRMALEPGHGRTAVPVRSAVVSTTLAVASIVAAAVFGASLIALVSTPSAYGQNWDQIVDLGFGNVPAAMGGEIAARVPSVSGYAAGNYGQLTIDGTSVAAIGLDLVRGSDYLTVLHGRGPASADEIALGAATMHALGKNIGQTVDVSVHLVTGGEDKARVMRIVGEPVLPEFSRGTFAPTGLGTGAVVTAAVTSAPGNTDTACTAPATCYNFFLLRYKPGSDVTAAGVRITSALVASGCPIGLCAANSDQRPGDIRNYATIRDTPVALGALLAVLAVGTLAHVLLTSVRRRGRDLALLKTLGFTRWQVLRLVAWQASAFAALALLIGLPLGVVAGRWAWELFAGSVGVGSQPDVPLTLILLLVPTTLALTNLIAAWPGLRAAWLRPARVLRME